MRNLIKFLKGSSRRLNFIIRFNTRIKTYDESVSAHSFYVAIYVYVIGNLMKKKGYTLNIDRAIRYSLFHDFEECMAGDILTPFKIKFEKEYQTLCSSAMEEILSGLDKEIKIDILQNWRNSKIGIEGLLVEFCDDLAGLIFCNEQIKTGNLYFYDIYEDYLKRLKFFGEKNKIFKEIVENL